VYNLKIVSTGEGYWFVMLIGLRDRKGERMKKRFCILIVVMVVFGLAACSRSKPSVAPVASAVSSAPAKTTYVSIGTAGTGGYFYAMGAAVANIINKYVPGVEASAEATGGSSENCTLVGDGELEMGFANGNIVYAAYHGLEPYAKKYSDIRSMFAIQSSVFHVVTMQGNGISTINDLRGRRVVVGPAGGGQILLFSEIISYYNMTLKDITPVYISYTDGVSELIDGNCDAVITMAALPGAAYVELAAKTDKWMFVEFDPVLLDQCVKSSTYFLPFTIEAGTYSGQTKDHNCIAASSVMAVNANVPDDVVYNICKAVYEHLDDLVNTVDSAKEMKLETGSRHPVDLHPGAEKFFRDKGVLN
jgi:TRAP transporter TAXI family solute receptor